MRQYSKLNHMHAELLSRVKLSATPWTVACQAPPSMGILQARILEWVATSSSRGSSQLREQAPVSCFSCIGRQVFHSSVQFSSVAQLCLALCDPMNRSTPGLPVHHQLPEFTQIHVHRVTDAIQPSHPLSSPSPPAPNPSRHQSLFQ